ncbi:hypothetical protein BU23DRAFT_653398 [Bimuria novae-zelandiae CBS 107.79]|uniref:NAD(P)-binding protein n=1 Tax=Bimuria novae-zelandiae CBS 107.79 TaxID=1447943 RepID=A0A6A5V2P2_9PLEO|nr:hypothetical protein BU23DRAFT_653398 [Bimuria novae-zelandiae CBS 107.79]
MPSYVIVGTSAGYGLDYQFLRTISEQDPQNVVIAVVRSPKEFQAKLDAEDQAKVDAEKQAKVDAEKQAKLDTGARCQWPQKNVHIIYGDMDSHTSRKSAADKTAEITGGVVDYLIVNACNNSLPTLFMKPAEFVDNEDLYLNELTQAMRTNVGGNLFAFNAFMRLILKSNIKRVAAITSAAAARDFIFEAEYSEHIQYATSKAALNTLVAKFAARYKNDGVLFVALHTGFVDTYPNAPKNFRRGLLCIGLTRR